MNDNKEINGGIAISDFQQKLLDSFNESSEKNAVVGVHYPSKSPFYHDSDILNTMFSVSLHANSELDEKTGEWRSVTEVVDDEGYSKEYLLRAPLLEDYNVSARNTWSEFGDDAIGSLWNSLKPYEPYVDQVTTMLDKIMKTNNELKDSGSSVINTSSFGIAENVVSMMKNVTSKASKYLNRSLVVQGARFSYYSGTSTSFGNLSMKFTVFSGWMVDYWTSGKTVWMSVDDQIGRIFPYVCGRYKKGVSNLEEGDLGMSKETAGQVNEIINEFTAWQMPPAGYKPDIKNIDNCAFGTLKLKFGAFYSLSSLICTNAQFNYSKQVTKMWDKNLGKNVLYPLYCDVILNFQPSTKYSDDAMRRFMSGDTMKDEISAVKQGLKNNLEKIKNQLKENMMYA